MVHSEIKLYSVGDSPACTRQNMKFIPKRNIYHLYLKYTERHALESIVKPDRTAPGKRVSYDPDLAPRL